MPVSGVLVMPIKSPVLPSRYSIAVVTPLIAPSVAPEALTNVAVRPAGLAGRAGIVRLCAAESAVTAPSQVFSREMLLEQVWGYHYKADTRLVNVHVQRLRAKVEIDPDNPKIVMTVRGVGYRAGAVV